MMRKLVLTLSCPDRPGIVANVSAALFQTGFNIEESHQFDDSGSGHFFMRVVASSEGSADLQPALEAALQPIAQTYAMSYQLHDAADRRRVMLLVSKFDHCLVDIIYRWRIGELNMDIVAVVSNHPKSNYTHLQLDGIPFHYLPVTASSKPQQETALLNLIEVTGAELVVLARYMQILSDEFASRLEGRCINIHHSFLPGFKGAKPYHQAHARGVKLIGATAHYVTAELDEGPIIEQDVERITHSDTPEYLVRKGRDIERRVLSRAVAWHLQNRVILCGSKTIVFS